MQKVTVEVSSERLRMVIPLMSKHRISVTPEHFWVWYEFVAGDNTPLVSEIERLIEEKAPLDDAGTADLYRRFIESEERKQDAVTSAAIRRLIEAMSVSLGDADSDVTRYGVTLGECASELDENISEDRLKALVGDLIGGTQSMRERSAALHTHLEESRAEIKSLKEQVEHVNTQAKTDPMTKLLNRKGFEEGLAGMREAFADQAGTHSLLIADIDKFKNVNDTYGHLFGDKIIKIVAKTLSNVTKGKDIAARFGGEEFVVVLPETGIAGGVAVSESIRKSIEKGRIISPKTKQQMQGVTISIGVTEFALSESIDKVIERADAALYRAKEGGRNRVEVGMAVPHDLAANG